MNVFVKLGLTLVLVALMALTLGVLMKISGDQRARPTGSQPRPVPGPDEPRDFSSIKMTERSGKGFSFDVVKGRVWVGNTFFTQCTAECQALNQTVAALQKDPLFEGVQFVSISVDPNTDTPQRLAEYALAFDAEPDRWFLLSGELDQAAEFGRQVGTTVGLMQHSGRLFLFDHEGKLRGSYMYNDPNHMREMRDLVPELIKARDMAVEAGAEQPS